ncbi:hypothetical protein [Cohnella yongneupensis]|uniref:Uncharacterized protein n=1 Tax=Cohnella yongneupensis TaxID=425006 RepID=A0ABW0R560_9BACL
MPIVLALIIGSVAAFLVLRDSDGSSIKKAVEAVEKEINHTQLTLHPFLSKFKLTDVVTIVEEHGDTSGTVKVKGRVDAYEQHNANDDTLAPVFLFFETTVSYYEDQYVVDRVNYEVDEKRIDEYFDKLEAEK